MLALSGEYSFVAVNRLALNHEHNISECWVVNYCSHVSYQAIDCLIIYFVLFELSDIKDTNVIQPLAPVEASKDK
jgi:hypothetical protein